MYKLGEYMIIFDHQYDYDIHEDEISNGIILKDGDLEIEIVHQFDIGYTIYVVNKNQVNKKCKLDEESIKLLPAGIKVEKV